MMYRERELTAAIEKHMWMVFQAADVITELQRRGVTARRVMGHVGLSPKGSSTGRKLSVGVAVRVLQATGLHDFTVDPHEARRCDVDVEELAALEPLSTLGEDSLVGELFVTPTQRVYRVSPPDKQHEELMDKYMQVFATCSEQDIDWFLYFQGEVAVDVLQKRQNAEPFFKLGRYIADCWRALDAGMPDDSLPAVANSISSILCNTHIVRRWPGVRALAVDTRNRTRALMKAMKDELDNVDMPERPGQCLYRECKEPGREASHWWGRGFRFCDKHSGVAAEALHTSVSDMRGAVGECA